MAADLPRAAIVRGLVAAGVALESVDGRRQLEEVFLGLVAATAGAAGPSADGLHPGLPLRAEIRRQLRGAARSASSWSCAPAAGPAGRLRARRRRRTGQARVRRPGPGERGEPRRSSPCSPRPASCWWWWWRCSPATPCRPRRAGRACATCSPRRSAASGCCARSCRRRPVLARRAGLPAAVDAAGRRGGVRLGTVRRPDRRPAGLTGFLLPAGRDRRSTCSCRWPWWRVRVPLGVLTDAPLAAVGGAVLLMIVCAILDPISALGGLRQGLPGHYAFAWADACRPRSTGRTWRRGALVGRLRHRADRRRPSGASSRKDITS